MTIDELIINALVAECNRKDEAIVSLQEKLAHLYKRIVIKDEEYQTLLKRLIQVEQELEEVKHERPV